MAAEEAELPEELFLLSSIQKSRIVTTAAKPIRDNRPLRDHDRPAFLVGLSAERSSISGGAEWKLVSTVAIKRYPRRGRVSTNRGWSADSCNTSRSRFTALLR